MFTQATVKSEAVSPVDNQPFCLDASAVRQKEQGPCFFVAGHTTRLDVINA